MNTEIESLAYSAQRGDREAAERLLLMLTPQIDQLISSWGFDHMGLDVECMRQESLLAAYIAIHTWCDNTPFERHAMAHVRCHLAKLITSHVDPDPDLFPPPLLPQDPLQTYLDRELIQDILSRLSGFHHSVFHGIFIAGYTPVEMARSLACRIQDILAAIEDIRETAKIASNELAAHEDVLPTIQ